MKKGFKVAIVLCLLAVVVAGCAGGKSSGGVSVKVDENTKFYQYEVIDKDKVFVTVKGKEYKLSEVPKDLNVKLVSEVCTGSTLELEVGGEKIHFTLKNYVPVFDLVWLYDGKNYFPEGSVESGALNVDKLSGTIQYDDDRIVDVNIKSADCTVDDDGTYIVKISDGVNSFVWEALEEGLNPSEEFDENAGSKTLQKQKAEEEKGNSSDDSVEPDVEGTAEDGGEGVEAEKEKR